MKRTFLTIITLATFIFHVQSQKLNLGVKGGLNISTISNPIFKTRVLFKYHVGAYSSIKVNKFGGQVEVVYSAQGSDLGQRL